MDEKVLHDLKTPLTTIKVYTQILKEKYHQDRQTQNYLEKLDQQINKLICLIDNIPSIKTERK